MVYLLLITIGIIGLIIASIFDIKTSEVPDWLNYSLISSGLGIRIIMALSEREILVFLFPLFGLVTTFLLGSLMYYTKQWGGGDAKTFMAVAALFTTMPNHNFFLFDFTINLLIIGAIYSILFSAYLYAGNKKKINSKINEYFSKDIKKLAVISFLAIVLLAIISAINTFYLIVSSAFVFLIALFLFILPIIKIVEKISLHKTMPVRKLTEGDWITEDVYMGRKLIYSKKSPGITKEQIKRILASKIEKVNVRQGIPFIPSFLLALIVTLFFKNLVSYFI